jgi:HKD family nuclease
MLAETEIILIPYSNQDEKSILHILINELSSGKWTKFQAAIAFAKQSGNYDSLLDSLVRFAKAGSSIQITFGADSFGAETRGSDYNAIFPLLTLFKGNPNVRFYLYHEKGRTFHPKLYLFSNEEKHEALLIIGSSNWSEGGFLGNIEANVLISLDLTQEPHQKHYQSLQTAFLKYWQEPVTK